jgi:quaternary ammonium compound-resistance protein SugE
LKLQTIITIMNWIYLLLAGIFEIGWPLGFKLSQVTSYKISWILVAAISMVFSGIFLYLAQRTIPIGTAYAIWTGIGASGAFLLGILFFKDPISFFRVLSALLIIMGVIGLKLTS